MGNAAKKRVTSSDAATYFKEENTKPALRVKQVELSKDVLRAIRINLQIAKNAAKKSEK